MKVKRFKLYEIEHHGDESNAISELHRVGFENVRVLDRDHENEESISVEAIVPEGMSFSAMLAEAEVCS